ncbi:hypothetical protein BC830DRAFT_1231447 [Chytriomyces sp. MP71]|nr:hypothetical protein BC830DRAFT_1231447 [Chytriomyces sp. MP71]
MLTESQASRLRNHFSLSQEHASSVGLRRGSLSSATWRLASLAHDRFLFVSVSDTASGLVLASETLALSGAGSAGVDAELMLSLFMRASLAPLAAPQSRVPTTLQIRLSRAQTDVSEAQARKLAQWIDELRIPVRVEAVVADHRLSAEEQQHQEQHHHHHHDEDASWALANADKIEAEEPVPQSLREMVNASRTLVLDAVQRLLKYLNDYLNNHAKLNLLTLTASTSRH